LFAILPDAGKSKNALEELVRIQAADDARHGF
jgi:hypothetical protein